MRREASFRAQREMRSTYIQVCACASETVAQMYVYVYVYVYVTVRMCHAISVLVATSSISAVQSLIPLAQLNSIRQARNTSASVES